MTAFVIRLKHRRIMSTLCGNTHLRMTIFFRKDSKVTYLESRLSRFHGDVLFLINCSFHNRLFACTIAKETRVFRRKLTNKTLNKFRRGSIFDAPK